MNKHKYLSNFFKGAFIVLFSVLAVYGVVQANTSITPPSGAPVASFYTLSNIWTRLTTNGTATEGGHLFTFAEPLAGTHVTLTQIYNAIPTIDATKVRLDTPYLGITGTLVPSGGDAVVGNVLADKTFFGASQSGWNTKIGTMPNNTGQADFSPTVTSVAIPIGFYDGVTKISGDANLVEGNIAKDVPIFGVTGTAVLSLGDAIASDVLAGKYFSNATTANVLGTMVDRAAISFTPSTVAQTILAGYYNGTGTVATDADLVATNIGADVNIFGVTGTLLKNLYNGSASSGDYPGAGAGAGVDVGGVDDYNAGGARPATSYAKTWTDCNASPYCGADSNADKKDDSTGLIWSKWMDAGATKTWFYANSCLYPNGLGDGVCDTHNEAACKCVKLTGAGGNGAKTGCEALGDGFWRLPYQKELMQAYIDGSWNSPANLSNAGAYYWSATTTSHATQNAWTTTLYYGSTTTNTKTNSASYRVRCVR